MKMNPNIDYKTVEFTGLPTSFFEQNRKNYIQQLKSKLTGLEENSILFLKGGKEIYRYDNDDDLHYFMQESNFYYLTGVREAGFYAMIDLKDSSVTLYVPTPDETTKIFFHVETLEEISAKYGARAVELEKMPTDINTRNPKAIYVLNGINSDSGRKIYTCDYVFPEAIGHLNKRIDNNELIYEILADTRTVKTDDELALLQDLNNSTIEGHLNAMKNLKPGMIERDVENLFWETMIQNTYARNHPYEHICGCGNDGATLHYINNDKELKDGELILMDMGCKLCQYVSDVTSTVPVNGKFTEKQKGIYEIVLNANREVIKNIKPGVSWTDMHLLAEKVIITGLKDLGLLNGEVDEMVKARVCYYFMPHGLGHLMGLDVHDVGGYLSYTPPRSKELGLSSLRSARILTKNTVMTVEPGIYFNQYLLEKGFKDEKVSKYFVQDKVKEYYDFGGVRIEDDIYVTENGCVNMTEKMPRTVEEIEAAMKK